MTCPHCQHDNREGAAFCGGCGAPLHQSCPRCGSENPPGQKFCDACGQDLSPPSTQSGSSPARRPLSEAATAPASSAGERRHATVLFSDLSGFTAMSEQLDPEEVEGLMQQDEEGTVEALEARSAIFSEHITAQHGHFAPRDSKVVLFIGNLPKPPPANLTKVAT